MSKKKFKFFETEHIYKISKLAFILLFDDEIPKYCKDDEVLFTDKKGCWTSKRLFWYFYWCSKYNVKK